MGHSRRNINEFFFFYFFLFFIIFHLFLRHLIRYLHVIMQKHRHYIPVRIVDRSNLWALSSEIYLGYFFKKIIFHSFLGPSYMLSSSFNANMSSLHSVQNSEPVRPRGILVRNLTEFFCFLKRISHLFLGPLYMLSTSYHAKT